ncbi:phage NrS-1 polymerase family protein [Marinobacter sp. F4206]|uniref:phage NrS-1 polymerase family protein n=1 Tax=Marinobacter sp. F4206 TaxID=2861777 RepID=UPI001C5CE499|nr:DUF5906 domain-containing protein [Marinobacter sp. F4206]MBW4933275.1 hypothetical protein [Marinobacter sp. F4206]
MMELPEALAPLGQFRQFIGYRLIADPKRAGKILKKPVDIRTGQTHNPHDPAIWQDFATVAKAVRAGKADGVGFVLTATDPFHVLDIDDALQGGQWSPLSQDLMNWTAGAAIEISQSGTGLHIIGCGHVPAHGCKNSTLGLEFYHTERFIALTGQGCSGSAAHDNTAVLSDIVAAYFPPDAARSSEGWTDEPCPEWDGHTDDDELLRRAYKSGSAVSAFGNRASFKDLFEGREDALAAAYPDISGTRPYDASSADVALALHLAFWTGRDCERIQRLMALSGLKRDKWDRPDYLPRTIHAACNRCTDVHKKRTPEERRAEQVAENVRIGETVEDPAVPTLLTLEQMKREFAYIGDSGGVVHRPTGRVRKKEAAAGEYAGSVHTWKDPDTGKEKSAPALKLWLANAERISVDVLAWVPGAPELCAPPEIVNGNTRAFNTWRGLPAYHAPADWQERIKPFMEHVAYLVPELAERDRFLQWLAHIVQRPEELPHTCYLMITEQTGIGRNLLAAILVRVLRGYVAAGVALGAILDGQFNGRLSQKLLAIVDETREGMSDKRYVRGERLKGLITEEHRHINTKYGLQTVEQNCCRWLMFSNHYDALPFDNRDRRVIVIENPTQRHAPQYYARLYRLVNDQQFIYSVRAYLEGVDLTGFNPGGHAFTNEAKRRALDSMKSDTDKALEEFRDTWPGAITGRSHIRTFLSPASVNENHLTHAIERSGMINAGRRIGSRANKDQIIIVQPDQITREQVKAAHGQYLIDQITAAAEAFDQ